MPQIKANMKSMRQDAAKRAANAAVKSQIHGAMKKAVAAANSDNKEEAFRAAVSIIDSAAQKGVIHKNAAARKKSRLNANVNAAIAKAKAAEAKEKAEAAKEEAKEAYKEKMEEKGLSPFKRTVPFTAQFFYCSKSCLLCRDIPPEVLWTLPGMADPSRRDSALRPDI